MGLPPNYPLATNKTNATLRQDDHPAHHNAMAEDINAIAEDVQGASASTRRTGLWTFAAHDARTNTAATLNRCLYVPFRVMDDRTWESIGCDVATGIALGAFRVGVYADDGNGWPGAALYRSGALVATGTAFVEDTGISLATPPGLYWLAVVAQGAAATFVTASTWSERVSIIGAPGGTTVSGCVYQTGVSGALPATALPTASTPAAPVVFILAG